MNEKCDLKYLGKDLRYNLSPLNIYHITRSIGDFKILLNE